MDPSKQARIEKAIYANARAQIPGIVTGIIILIAAVPVFLVPTRLSDGWTIAGSACAVAGVGVLGVSLWLMRHFKRELERFRETAATQPD